MSRTGVLLLCTGDSARSRVAEAFVRDLSRERFEGRSAGLEPRGVHSLTLRVMGGIGLDLGGDIGKGVKEVLGRYAFQQVERAVAPGLGGA